MKRMTKFTGMMLMAVLAAGMITACGGGNVSERGVPDWFLNPPESDTKVYGTGASEKTSSIQLAKNVADAGAIDEVSRTVQVIAQNMTRTFLQQSGTIEEARALQFSETVSKQVVDVTLSGISIEQREINDGRCYSLAAISMDSVKKSLLSAIRDAAAEFSEQKARQALEDLENEVNKGNIPVVKPSN